MTMRWPTLRAPEMNGVIFGRLLLPLEGEGVAFLEHGAVAALKDPFVDLPNARRLRSIPAFASVSSSSRCLPLFLHERRHGLLHGLHLGGELTDGRVEDPLWNGPAPSIVSRGRALRPSTPAGAGCHGTLLRRRRSWSGDGRGGLNEGRSLVLPRLLRAATRSSCRGPSRRRDRLRRSPSLAPSLSCCWGCLF